MTTHDLENQIEIAEEARRLDMDQLALERRLHVQQRRLLAVSERQSRETLAQHDLADQMLTAQERWRLEIYQFALQALQYAQQCVDSAAMERHCRETLARMESLITSRPGTP